MILGIGLVFVAVIGIIAIRLSRDPNAPRYEPIKGSVKLPPGVQVHYDFLNPDPFADGKMWIYVHTTNEWHNYLFDIDRRQVLGEFFGQQPLFTMRGGGKFVCSARVPESKFSFLRGQIFEALSGLMVGKSQATRQRHELVTFWSIDLQGHSAKKMGEVIQSTSRAHVYPSPDRQFAFTSSSASTKNEEIILFNLDRESSETHVVPGNPFGWWDDANIVVHTPSTELMLYNVKTRSQSLLLGSTQLETFFETVGLTNAPQQSWPFLQWNGTNNVLYLTEGNKRWSAEESYLIRIEHPDGRPKLVSKSFKFEWSDHFDRTGTKYLYSGRLAGTNSDAVIVRDLATGTTNTLVPTLGEKYFSIPQFYKDTVIYIRSNALWQVSLKTSNITRLFPVQDSGAH